MAHRGLIRTRFSSRRSAGRITRGGKPNFGAYNKAVREGIKLMNEIKQRRK